MAATVNPALFIAGVKTSIYSGAMGGNGEPLWTPLFLRRTGDFRLENYAYLGAPPMLAAFTDTVQMSPLVNAVVTFAHQYWTAGFEVSRLDLVSDQTGDLLRSSGRLGGQASRLENQQIAALIQFNSSAGPIGYDNVSQWNATHPDLGAGVTQSNTVAGTGLTSAAINNDLGVAVGAMEAFLNDAGQPTNPSVNSIAVYYPPSLQRALLTAVNAVVVPEVYGANTAAAGVTNVLWEGRTLSLIRTPRATTGHNIYVFNTTMNPGPPFIFSDLEGLMVENTNPGSDNWVIGRKISFVASRYAQAIAGDWRTGFQITNA